MFGKGLTKGIPESGEMETLIGTGTVVQGTITSKGAVRIDGKLEGGVTEASQVVVGEKGEVQGDITCGSAVIGGKVLGNIVAQSSIEFLANAEIHGDIKTHALSIAEGATFEGNCTMTREKQVIEMEVSPTKAKRY